MGVECFFLLVRSILRQRLRARGLIKKMNFASKEMSENHSVAALLKSRLLGKKDNAKIGIVVEGGAMRGIFAAGAVLALEKMGTNNFFDSFYGISAGTITAAYFASSQAVLGTSIFYDNLASSRFISRRRALHPRKSIMNLQYLGRVLDDQKKLHTNRVIEKDFNAFALNIKTALLEKMEKPESREEMIGQLLAACTMPFLGPDKTVYRGQGYIDGGLSISVPWKEALLGGCTHLLVLLTRPIDSPRPPLGSMEKKIVGANLVRKNPDLLPLFLGRVEAYNDNLLELRERSASGENILIIAPPSNAASVRSLERRKSRLVEAGIVGARETYKTFFQQHPDFSPVIQPISRGRLL